MNYPTPSGAAEPAAPAAAFPTSSTLASGVREPPAVPAGDLQLARSSDEYDDSPLQEVQRRLNSLPMLLNCVVVSYAAEKHAAKFESLGATVELRPGWRK